MEFDLFGLEDPPKPQKPAAQAASSSQGSNPFDEDDFFAGFENPKPKEAAKPVASSASSGSLSAAAAAPVVAAPGSTGRSASKGRHQRTKSDKVAEKPAVERAPSSGTPARASAVIISDGSSKEEDDKKAEKKLKCAVIGCKNRRLRRKYCALHLNSEFDLEKDEDKSKEKNKDDWYVSRQQAKPSEGSKGWFQKNVITWNFIYKGEKHQVVLRHSPVGGKRTIWVNGYQVYQEKAAGSSKHPLSIGSSDATRVPCAVIIKQGMSGFEYDLEIRGGPFEDAREIWYNSPE